MATNSLASSNLDFCSYQRHVCSRRRYLNYKYCAQHILEDEKSPFTSCEYLSRTTKRKCPNPALRPRKQNSLPIFCSEHLHELIVKEKHQKQKRKLRRKRKIQKASLVRSESAKRQKLVNQLYKYSEETPKTTDGQMNHEDSESDVEDIQRPINDDWPLENPASIGTDADWDDFDPVNNEVYEPLRYADVLTPEEVVATAQSKLIRLQSLYIEQFKRLFHLLEERRRQYLQDLKSEIKEEKANSVAGFAKHDAEFEEKDAVHALAMCGKRTGVNALLRKRQLQKRQRSARSTRESFSSMPSSTQRCAHASNHTRCKASCLSYTKYCPSHILEDPHQLLYKKCHDTLCPLPVNHLLARPYPNDAVDGLETGNVYYCTLHAPLPEMTFTFLDIVTKDEKLIETPISLKDDPVVETPMLPEDNPIEQLYRYAVERDSNTATLDSESASAMESEPSGVFKKSESGVEQSQNIDDAVTDSVDVESSATCFGADNKIPSPISNAKNADPASVTVEDYTVCEQMSLPANVPSRLDEQNPSPKSDDENTNPCMQLQNLRDNVSPADATLPNVLPMDIGDSVDSCVGNARDLNATAENGDVQEMVPPTALADTSVVCENDKVLSNDDSMMSVDDEHTVGEQDALRQKNLAISTNDDAILLDKEDTVSVDDTEHSTANDVPGMEVDDTCSLERETMSPRVHSLHTDTECQYVKQDVTDAKEELCDTVLEIANPVGVLTSQKAQSSLVDSTEVAETYRASIVCDQSKSADTVCSDAVFPNLQSGLVDKSDEPMTVPYNSTHLCDKSKTLEISTPSVSAGVVDRDDSTPKSPVAPSDDEKLPSDATEQSLACTEPSAEVSKVECHDSKECGVPELNEEEEISKGNTSDTPDKESVFVSQTGERKPSSVEEEMAVVSLLRLCTGLHSDEAASSSTDQD